MRIKVKNNYAGPSGIACSAGGVIDIPQHDALELIRSGNATAVDPLPRAVVPETADLEPGGETADARPRRRKRRTAADG